MNWPVYVANWSFTGIHRCLTHNIVRNNEIDTFEKNINNLKGLIVISNGNYVDLHGNIDVNLNNSVPIAILCEKPNDKRVFGVIADMEQHADKPLFKFLTKNTITITEHLLIQSEKELYGFQI